MARRRATAALLLTLTLGGAGAGVASGELARSQAPTSARVLGTQTVSVPGAQPLPGQLPPPMVPPPTTPMNPGPPPATKSAHFLLALGDSVPVWNRARSYPYLVARTCPAAIGR